MRTRLLEMGGIADQMDANSLSDELHLCFMGRFLFVCYLVSRLLYILTKGTNYFLSLYTLFENVLKKSSLSLVFVYFLKSLWK